MAELAVVFDKEPVALTVTPELKPAEVPELEAEDELLLVLNEVFPVEEDDCDSEPVEEDPSETGPTALEPVAVAELAPGPVVAEVMAAVVLSPTTMVIVIVPGPDDKEGPIPLVLDDEGVS